MEEDAMTIYMKQRITEEKEDSTEFERGCGYIRFYSLAEYVCLGRLIAEGFTDYDKECSEWDLLSYESGVVWVC